MTRTLLTLLGFSLTALFAADPAGFTVWPKGVSPTPGKATTYDNHSLALSHRDKDGISELHAKVTDVFVIVKGEATLLVGGKVVGATAESPGELRGGKIEGGVKKAVSHGDVIHIPANMPHQFFVAPGKEVDYFVVKVWDRK